MWRRRPRRPRRSKPVGAAAPRLCACWQEGREARAAAREFGADTVPPSYISWKEASDYYQAQGGQPYNASVPAADVGFARPRLETWARWKEVLASA